jgi:pyruvate/2-oxoglutarate dehydrogenase complex dihydrolipoamide dehydrogenase (E3) component
MPKSITIPPNDEYNQELVAQTHPADWKNPKPADRYNLVVVGGGTAGLVSAAGAAGLGAKVALIERNLLGGDCLNVGCVPSKVLLAAAHAVTDVKRAAEFGIHVPDGVSVDFPAVMERVRKLRAQISHHDSAKRFKNLGVDVFLGDAHFTSRSSVMVNGTKLRFKKAVIATGGRAAAPPIAGLDQVDYLTNENLFNLTELPKNLGIVGAGPIGCEMAQAFARLGSKVTLVEAMPGILIREDQDAAKIVHDALIRDGVDIICCGEDLTLSKAKGGGTRLVVNSEGENHDLTVDKVLVSVGRAPNVDGLDLEKAGVEFTPQGIVIDDFLRTSNQKIFAAGDVCLTHKFTHMADFAARIVIQNSLFVGSRKLSALTVPWCTYTDPEIAHVGMYEKDAAERDIDVDTFIKPMAEIDRALAEGATEGFVKIHIEKGRGQIIGATIVSRHAGELISEITTAMAGSLTLSQLANVIHPYPTQAEAIRLTGDLYNRTKLTPTVKKIFTQWLKWSR